MRANLFRKGVTGQSFDSPGVDPHHPDLLAYWLVFCGRAGCEQAAEDAEGARTVATTIKRGIALRRHGLPARALYVCTCHSHLMRSSSARQPPPPCRNFDEGKGWVVRDITGRGQVRAQQYQPGLGIAGGWKLRHGICLHETTQPGASQRAAPLTRHASGARCCHTTGPDCR